MSTRETKVVGMASAFTGHSRSARIFEWFLREAGYRVLRTPRTTPDIMDAGATLSSADHCLPLRAYVGHVHRLLEGRRPPDVLLAPNVCSEDGLTCACAKYRDPGGVALRSLGSAVAYAVARASKRERSRVARFLGPEETARLVADGESFPEILEPDVWSLDPVRMEALGFRVLCRLKEVPAWRRRFAPFLPPPLADVLAPWTDARRAMRTAMDREAGRRSDALRVLRENPEQPRLGLIGREYLVEDPLLTADVKSFFAKAGCEVVTPPDVPFDSLREAFMQSPGYYESQRLNAAFIEFAADLPVDGFVMVSSFGCHPDAFESEWLADLARSKGIPAWYFRFDEQSGRAGFKTRFETILSFLEGERDVRLGRRSSAVRGQSSPDGPAASVAPTPVLKEPAGDPLVTWPSFSVAVDLALEEVFHQAGLGSFVVPPLPPTLETIALGEGKYAESCCPFGITTGSFVQTLSDLFDRLETDARDRGETVQPRRIFLVQGRAEGPCVYGWYSLAQAGLVPQMLSGRLERSGHTLEMASLGVQGAQRILADLAHLGDAEKLKPLLALAESGELEQVSHGSLVEVIRGLSRLIKPGRAKLDAAEEVRARALVVRAHELEPGDASRAEKAAYEVLRSAHDLSGIADARRAALRLVDDVPQDPSPRPRVVCVGEIYVVHSPLASRGAMDVLLGREGIEVVPGTTIGEYVEDSFRASRRRAIARNRLVARILGPLWNRGFPLLAHPVNRAPEARPFLWHEVGGEGVRSVAAARRLIEQGADGVLHVYPFKCMPEGMAKDALAELCRAYGVRYLPMSFGKETDIERMRTEIGTFAELLRVEMETRWGGKDQAVYEARKRAEAARRTGLGRALDGCVRSVARLQP